MMFELQNSYSIRKEGQVIKNNKTKWTIWLKY